jgi:hypothetical protein
MNKKAKPVVLALLAWFCFALAVGVVGWFRSVGAPTVALTVWTLTALALLACWKIQMVREWAGIVDLRWLIALHLARFVGIYFLILGKRGDLPQAFAGPAGFGDIVIATIALFILVIPEPRMLRSVLLLWNTLGLIDILLVIFGALRFGLRDWQSMAALRQLPLSLLPTFIVPLIITSHVLIFVRVKTRAQN